MILEINNVSKLYPNGCGIKDIDVHIDRHGVYGLLGKNGAGKTTTMNVVSGYLAATSGNVLVKGVDVLKKPEEAKKNIGYLPELPPLYMDMTPEEYLYFCAEIKGVKKAERAEEVEKVMVETHIDDVKNRLIKNLSKGYKQRVGLAQAMIGNPEVIIFDEPTVGLDPEQIIEVRDLIKQLGETHTVILSSHILSEVEAVCDHVFIINDGKLVLEGELQTLLSQYSSNSLEEVYLSVVKKEEVTIEDITEGGDM